MQIHGLHHVTAVTGNAPENVRFYTQVLGLRLVKKTVNQDDTSAYHLFYADKLGTPGTDITFFDWPQSGRYRPGTDSISRTFFRVNGQAALEYWQQRFTELGIQHHGIETVNGHAAIRFEDPEGQQLALVDDEGAPFEGEEWNTAEIPVEYALRGFYATELTIPEREWIEPILTQLLGFAQVGEYENLEQPGEKVVVYGVYGGGPGKEIHVVERAGTKQWFGAGGVHHVAFRVKDEAEIREWAAFLNKVGLGNSGMVERFYFKSLYFRISNGILFELATDGPGFSADEEVEHLGEALSLPPFLEPKRAQIEAGLRPL